MAASIWPRSSVPTRRRMSERSLGNRMVYVSPAQGMTKNVTLRSHGSLAYILCAHHDDRPSDCYKSTTISLTLPAGRINPAVRYNLSRGSSTSLFQESHDTEKTDPDPVAGGYVSGHGADRRHRRRAVRRAGAGCL